MIIRARVGISLAVLALILSCKHQTQATSNVDALPHARSILGPAKPWQHIEFNAENLKNSITERRKAGWKILEQVLSRVPVINPKTGMPFLDMETGQPLSLPLWQTWYEINEFQELFSLLYWGKLNDSQRGAGEAPAALVDAAMAEHHEKTLLKKWTKPLADGQTRFEKLLGQLGSSRDISALNGVSGRGYTLYSPALIRHLLLHYNKVRTCAGTAPDFSSGDPDRDLATCLDAPFPVEAVAIKATWNSATAGVARFDTSERGMAQILSQPSPTWKPVQTENLLFPSEREIYTSNTFLDDQRSPAFGLTGLHVLTKDIPEWMWVSVWWSPNPDEDFGEDRPEVFKRLGPPGAEAVWSNYKMCVASTFDEGDVALKNRAAGWMPGERMQSTERSLVAAQAASAYYTQPHSFCSNPYIEFSPGVAKSNCIGCHQHSGPLASGARQKPDLAQVRKSFMTDFMWSFDSREESFQRTVKDVIDSGSPF